MFLKRSDYLPRIHSFLFLTFSKFNGILQFYLCLVSVSLWESSEAFLNCYTAQSERLRGLLCCRKKTGFATQRDICTETNCNTSFWNNEHEADFRLRDYVIMTFINGTACFSVQVSWNVSAWIFKKICKSVKCASVASKMNKLHITSTFSKIATNLYVCLYKDERCFVWHLIILWTWMLRVPPTGENKNKQTFAYSCFHAYAQRW